MAKHNIKIASFKNWLINQGCEILPVSNEHESLRFKGQNVGVVYKSGKTSSNYVDRAIRCYKTASSWDGRPISTGRKTSYKKRKEDLLRRDGGNCFYCGEPLKNDITLEHLQSLTSGGKDTIGNSVLCHEECNHKAGAMTVVEKVSMAIKMRSEKKQITAKEKIDAMPEPYEVVMARNKLKNSIKRFYRELPSYDRQKMLDECQKIFLYKKRLNQLFVVYERKLGMNFVR